MPVVDVAYQHPAAQTIGAVVAVADQVYIVQQLTMWIHLVASLINFVLNSINSATVAFEWRLLNVLCHHRICSIAYCFEHGLDVATNMNSVDRQYSIYSCYHCDGPHDDVVFVPLNNADMHLSMDDALVWHLIHVLYATFFCLFVCTRLPFTWRAFLNYFGSAFFRMHFFLIHFLSMSPSLLLLLLLSRWTIHFVNDFVYFFNFRLIFFVCVCFVFFCYCDCCRCWR